MLYKLLNSVNDSEGTKPHYWELPSFFCDTICKQILHSSVERAGHRPMEAAPSLPPQLKWQARGERWTKWSSRNVNELVTS